MLKGQKKNTPINLIGNVYGRLTVLSLDHREQGKRKYYHWLCKCDCGVEKVIHQELLRSGRTKSCGCLLTETRKAKGNRIDKIFRGLYSSLKKRHNKRFLSTPLITFNSFKKISTKDCFYCGTPPASKQYDVRYDGRNGMKRIEVTKTVFFTNGIDRVDNSKGYTELNVVPCCKYCNAAKSAMTQQEFKNLIKRIYINWANK